MYNLDSNKATGPDGIGNRLLKETASSLASPLSKLFNKSLQNGEFPDIWKVSQVVALHKKGDIHLCENYRPISLLCCVSKVFEKVVYNHVYSFLRRHNILASYQSGFRAGDSTVRQLASICHKIYCSLDEGEEILSVFLDFRKAFDRVWHAGLLFKLEKIGIKGKLLAWFGSYLQNRQQYVTIQGSVSSTKQIMAGVPQGSVLGPLLFLIFINDIGLGIASNIQLYADDTSLFKTVKKGKMVKAVDTINNDLAIIHKWCQRWLMQINETKSVVMLISRKTTPSPKLPIRLGDAELAYTNHHKHLGLTVNAKFNWSDHIGNIVAAASKCLNMLTPLKYKIPRLALEMIYQCRIRPLLEYADIIWDNCNATNRNDLENIQIRAAQIVSGAKRYTSHAELYNELGWVTLADRRKQHKLVFFHKLFYSKSPQYLYDLLPQSANQRTTRATNNQLHPQYRCKLESFRTSTLPSSIRAWNELSPDIRQTEKHSTFKIKIKKIFDKDKNILYYIGSRKCQIITAQMRMKFSNLNAHLHQRGCVDSPVCPCGIDTETLEHFFFECELFEELRHNLLSVLYDVLIEHNITVSHDVLLNGCCDIPYQTNERILFAVHEFITATGRFQ